MSDISPEYAPQRYPQTTLNLRGHARYGIWPIGIASGVLISTIALRKRIGVLDRPPFGRVLFEIRCRGFGGAEL